MLSGKSQTKMIQVKFENSQKLIYGHRNQKVVATEWTLSAKGHKQTFWGDENVLIIVNTDI